MSFSVVSAQNQTPNSAKQIAVSTAETVFLHCNAATFVSGETLLYKLYCLNAANHSPSAISKIAYVEFVSSGKEIVFRHKLFLENGSAAGDFFIPASLTTGNYKLIAYTNWTLNNTTQKAFETDVFIINPFQVVNGNNPDTPQSIGLQETASQLNAQTIPSDNNFALYLNRKTYAARKNVAFSVKGLTANSSGKYSMSIRKIDELPTKNLASATSLKDSETIPTLAGNHSKLPELRGEMISGKITSKYNSEIANVTIALSLPGKSFAFKTVKTNSAGKFIFNLEKNYANPEAIVQVMDQNRDNYVLTLDSPIAVDASVLTFPTDIHLKKNMRTALLERSVANQVENAYYNKKNDSATVIKVNDLFFDPLAKNYVFDDYTRFPKLEETIIEVVKEMSFTKNNGKYAIHLRDIYAPIATSEQTLVLVDGLLIQDINELFDYDTRNFSKVTIVPGGYYYGSSFFNGIVNFVTKNNDYVSRTKGDFLLKSNIERPLQKKDYYVQKHTDNSQNRIPDYRYQLLWQPELELSAGENPVTFYTSDVLGKFEIVLEGFTDKGIPVSLKETIEVK